MPVQYNSREELSNCPNSNKTKDSTTERLKELYQGAITTILKSRVERYPSADYINSFIEQLDSRSTKSYNKLFLTISICERKGITQPVEEWCFETDQSKKDRTEKSKCYKTSEKTLFFQTVYNSVKRSPFEDKLQSGLYSRENILFNLDEKSQLEEDHAWQSQEIQPIRIIKSLYFRATIKSLESQKPEAPEKLSSLEQKPFFTTPIISKPFQQASSPSPFDSNWKGPLSRFSSSPCSNKHLSEAFVGSYEESLLSGRMSALPSKPIEGFLAKIGIFSGGCSTQFSIPFSANFYQHKSESFSPYVGTVLLEPDFSSSFKIPLKGKLQVVIINPNATAVQFFLVPYDLRDMPLNSKTFLRHRIHVNRLGHSPILRQAIHVQFARSSFGELYLYRSFRVVFPLRAIDDETATTASSFDQPPESIRFSSLAPSASEGLGPFPPSAPHDPIFARACDQDSYLGYQ
ncbi:hypothetical protein DSO57_1002292 [Entomophthora muscae]|uniref:Uncharacterized protein n=1 Tax=Entomophthora muscae TaxID=34485 RepID=A0ACC2TKG8_9FUNG|nr:hypothetical protein DSO57_1002292 [Entomophthora muscae]